jgi:hypothetical protein
MPWPCRGVFNFFKHHLEKIARWGYTELYLVNLKQGRSKIILAKSVGYNTKHLKCMYNTTGGGTL